MKKLIKMFKSLPPEMRMMLAMAGLGSPIGIIYALKRWCFPHTSTFVVILYVVGAIAVICLLGWLVSLLFGRGKGKRANKMASDLAADADAGRSSMDVAAAIKENNQKFFGAISDMNKSVGLSVYDLPWYIVIGDSGCGKTKLINEGGLQFSLGKPEGYQLGTLNYNWWFTEDAVFVDMAGRLINPRDDADRKEWEAFLSTVSKGRKGFPINGVVVCVAADHLLQDPPDRIEQDANTMLERLRDLQSRLGVTFATYLVITKCDKMVGFMQFFDRAERDIRVLNQMVGWSKPGEFHELYEPEEFPDNFDEVYRRLHELRLRRMNDDAEEIDLGLAYGFPEEFRELRDPLHTYVRTLFPKIKNPRAIKNLLFRGLYFTSATREGGLILKHLTDRLGPEAAEQFQPLDLYPSKRPYFIRDFFFRKMFPEHGLVFRNEEQAVRNRKLAKVLKWGSVGLALLLFGTAGLSIWKFNGVIGKPRELATVKLAPEKVLPEPPAALESADELQESANTLSASGWAKMLSMFVDTDEPVRGLREIHAALFERVLLREAIADISQALGTIIPDAPIDETTRETGQAYLDALEQYVKWYACSGDDASSWRGTVTQDSFKTMCKIVTKADSPIKSEGFLTQSGYYFDTVKQSDAWKSPARLLSRNEDPERTIKLALDGGARKYLKAFATLDSNNPNPVIGEWMRIWAACDQVQKSYDVMLAYASASIETSEQMVNLKHDFRASYANFATNLARTGWESEHSISQIREAILKNRSEAWVAYVGKLTTSLTECGHASDSGVAEMVNGLQHTNTMEGLDEYLWGELKRTGLTTKPYPKDAYGDNFMKDVDELYKPFDYMIRLDPDAANEEKLKRTDHANLVNKVLADISKALDAANLAPDDPPGAPAAWIRRFESLYEPNAKPVRQHGDISNLVAAWRPRELRALDARHKKLIEQGSLTAILDTIRVGLSNPGTHGLAMLQPEANDLQNSAYYIEEANVDTKPPSTVARNRTETSVPRETPNPRRAPRRRAPPRRGGSADSANPRPIIKRGEGKIPEWAQRTFLNNRVDEAADLKFYLSGIQIDDFLPSGTKEILLTEACAQMLQGSAENYFKAYVQAWSDAYGALPLDRLEKLVADSTDWKSLLGSLGRNVNRVGKEYQAVSDEVFPALSEILASIPFWGHTKVGRSWESPYSDDRAHYAAVAEWMRSAIGNDWNQNHGVFASKATIHSIQGVNRKGPWTAIENAFATKWDNLGASIVRVKPFPELFTGKTKPAATIKWPAFAELRRSTQLEDERITGALQAFEQRAQGLLGSEITRVLVGIQNRRLDQSSSTIGWPYLDDTEAGSRIAISKTVEFQAFRDFLREVRNASLYFAPLEAGLPDSEAKRLRARFYERSGEWFRFLGLSETNAQSTATDSLKIEEVKFSDSFFGRPGFEDIERTGANFYKAVELDLGLEIQEAGANSYVAKPLHIPTRAAAQVQKSWKARWNWKATGDMTFSVVEPFEAKSQVRYPTHSKTLGSRSPLSFCSYLRSGEPQSGDRKVWVTVHQLDVAPKWKGNALADKVKRLDTNGDGKLILGLGFEFRLAREMPKPIAELKLSYESSE